MPITDLTGYTWVANNSLTITTQDNATYNINGEGHFLNNQGQFNGQFTSITIEKVSNTPAMMLCNTSVVYDAIKITKEKNADVLICDTAGRLHNKKYLMDELYKIQKVIDKELPDADKEVLLVIDATTGQNAISQVKAFKEVAPITGLVLTKLDGTAKGGVVIGIVNENKIPVKFIGVGETIDDMEVFNSKDFVDAII